MAYCFSYIYISLATLSGCRRGFETLRTSEAELRNQKAAMDGGGGFKTINIDNGHDPEVPEADRSRSEFASDGGGSSGGEGTGGTPGVADIIGYETVGNGGHNGSSAYTRAEERTPLAGPRLQWSSRAPDLEGRKSHSSVYGGAYGSSRSEGGEIGSGESLEEGKTRKSAYMREFLMPFRLLEEKRVRTILFVFFVFSVRISFCFVG